MTIKVEFKDSFFGSDFLSDSIAVEHKVEWEGCDASWDEHMVNFLTFLSMCGYIIEHSWIEKLQDTAQELRNPSKCLEAQHSHRMSAAEPRRIATKKRSKK